MLRLLLRRPLRRPPWRRFSSEAPSTVAAAINTANPLTVSPSPPLQPSSPPARRRAFPVVFSASLLSAAVAAVIVSSSGGFDETMERTRASVERVLDRMGRTAAAAAALWRSLASVLSSVDHEVRSGFELRVAALLADISAASRARRAAIVGAGGGAVVDWLLESVAVGGGGGVQAEAARALAHLVADPEVAGDVLGRPHAVPYFLKFIFSFQPKKPKTQLKRTSFSGPDLCIGSSMLVAALMDIITSNGDHSSSFQPLLPKKADMRDIAAAIQVIEEGGMHFDDHLEDDDPDDGGRGVRGIGIKIFGDATVLGLARKTGILKLNTSEADNLESARFKSKNTVLQENIASSPKFRSLTAGAVPGLWDDLQREHVAVPFAAWALANWSLASELNRAHIQELDKDGNAVMSTLTAPERTVKWHGTLVARALLSDKNLPLTDSVTDWSSSLLSTIYQACKVEDIPLAQVALSAFLLAIERSNDAKVKLMESGLDRMREIAKLTEKHRNLQEAIVRVIEILYDAGMHFSLEESQRWCSILLCWIFGNFFSDTARPSAAKILSIILEDHGPNSIPISQGWLAIMLTEILGASKTSAAVNAPIKTDKVKTQIDQSNALSAAQVTNQLALAAVKLAKKQFEYDPDSVDTSPLADFLSLEPFHAQSKNLTKNGYSKFDAADSASAMLKGIKALTEVCSEDDACKNRLVDFGVLCLLRRCLLNDDYEKLAAMETYDASRAIESTDRASTVAADSSSVDSTDPSSIRVPPTAHIRRHAARLLMILSLLPNVKMTVAEDETWCRWLEHCASGKNDCCSDPKVRSYARATLLNIFCSGQDRDTAVRDNFPGVGGNPKIKCSYFEDMIFLINPELPHWKCSDGLKTSSQDSCNLKDVVSTSGLSYCDNYTESENNNDSDMISQSAVPSMDVVFIHGLRGGPFKSWRIADDKSSTTSKSGLVEKIDQEAGKQGTFWPSEWLTADFPDARLFTVKYKTNLTQWSGASLPLQEVSSMMLQKLTAAGIGDRPVVFVTHSMGGLVVKQMLYQAKMSGMKEFVNNTIGVVFYSCPHFGSKLADMPWRMGLVFRPAPSIGELRSGSPRLLELNDFIRHLHNKGILDVLSFSETQVTPIVEGYGGWAVRMEIVPIESAYPGFGELIVLDGTDHINSCKPVNPTDPSYSETLDFLRKLKAQLR
ncbi:hypothetical protein J5N97_017929 [Dioscorea zingiberensis]|uniref:GPI inositol-deacylase n=1 Tax=Dioscorea zingiberensis TaxID=325984 RepID=A0A9D5HGU1_9LILI|nr:hypothetical protein J5N97_017929 [Dioscorea zingiberensis]